MSSTTFRSQDIVDLIKSIESPFNNLQFFHTPQNPLQRLYPSVEVSNTKPLSTKETVETVEHTNRFDIIILARYGDRSNLTADLYTLERNIITALESAVLGSTSATPAKIRLEAKDFARSEIKNNPKRIDGIQSTLTIQIIEVSATESGVSIGSDITITIGTITDAKVYNKPAEVDTENTESVYDKSRTRTKLFPIGDETLAIVEIGYTQARMDQLRTLKSNHAQISYTVKRSGTSEIRNGFVTQLQIGATFEGVETIIIGIEVINV